LKEESDFAESVTLKLNLGLYLGIIVCGDLTRVLFGVGGHCLRGEGILK
jgi:hypothetical protein